MGNWYAIDAVSEGIAKARGLLRSPGLPVKWLKLAVLFFIIEALSGGGGRFSYNLSDSDAPQIADIIRQAGQFQFELVVLAVVVAVVFAFVFGAIVRLIRNAFFFSALESVSAGDVKILGYLGKFFGPAASLTLFEIVLGLVALPFMIAFFISIAGIALMFGFVPAAVTSAIYSVPALAGIATFAANPVTAAILGIIGILGLAVFAIVSYIKGQFAEYLMYRQNRRAWDAFKHSLGIVRRNLLQVIMLIVVQIIVGAAAVLAMGLVSLMVFAPLIVTGVLGGMALDAAGMAGNQIVTLPIAAAAAVVAAVASFIVYLIIVPLIAFFYCFNLSVIDGLAGGGAVITVAKGAKGWPKGAPR